MKQLVDDTYLFHLGRPSYNRTSRLSLLLAAGFLLCTLFALFLSIKLLGTYSHTFTFYLKWQDALVALLWFVAILGLVGSSLTLRFMAAIRAGYVRGMLILTENQQLSIRDLSPANLASIFWMLNAAFWCFVAVLIGFSPEILIGWTIHLSQPVFAVLGTAIAIVLSLAGLAVSGVAASFLVIGCFGAVSFFRKLGSSQTYKLDTRAALRVDNGILTIIYPGLPEAMLDLNTLSEEDQHALLSLVQTRLDATREAEEVSAEVGKSGIVLV